MAGQYDLTLYQGEDKTYAYTLLDGGVPIDVTGWTLLFRVWELGNDNIMAVAVNLDDAEAGQISVDLAAADTQLAAKVYRYEIRRTNAGSVTAVVVGTLTVRDSPYYAG